MSAIIFKDFKCYYKNKKKYTQVLFDINFEVKEGEFLVVIGESGSGKTTLIKACLGIADVFEGDIYIGGDKIDNISKKSGRYAYVHQDYSLYSHLTVYENLAFPLRMIKTSQAEVDMRVRKVAKDVGMDMFLNRKPKQLSGGQQQRVALGRALIKNPLFLFLDEPFSNVDKNYRLELRQLIKELHEKLRPTTIFVTHELNEAFAFADRILVLENGRIAEFGTPDELREHPTSDLLKNFFGIE